MNNIKLFEYSLENKEGLLDNPKKSPLVITENSLKKNELMTANEKLIDLITTYATLTNMTKKQKSGIIDKIDNLLFEKDKMNYSAISQYFMVWNVSHSLLSSKPKKERKKYLKKLIKEYINDRHEIYKSHGYSNIVLQVLSDNYSHKRQGMTGLKKLETFITAAGIEKYNDTQKIKNGTFYLLPDKEGKSAFKHIIKQKKIKLKWSKDKQNKMPDAYIQKKDRIYIIEHKNKKESGGGQNSAHVEMIDFIKNSDKNISYVIFLDGELFNNFADNINTNKILKTKQDIYKYLKMNKLNYFLNTSGFKKLLESI